MIVKVNQITSAAEAERFANVDIAGFVVGESCSGRTIDADTYRHLRRRITGAASAHVVGGVHDTGTVAALIGSLAPDYLEFTVVDPEKRAASEAQLEVLSRLEIPKIANGLFLLRDECSLLARTAHLDTLMSVGVAFFQIEIDSLTDPANRITTRNRAQIADLCARYPVLVSDDFDVPYPNLGQRGVFLNLAAARDTNYDHSLRRRSPATGARAIRNLAR